MGGVCADYQSLGPPEAPPTASAAAASEQLESIGSAGSKNSLQPPDLQVLQAQPVFRVTQRNITRLPFTCPKLVLAE